MRARAASFVLCGALVTSVARDAAAERIRVRVVDVAGGRVYLEPGLAKGLRVGDTVELAGKRYKVVQASSTFSAVDSDDPRITVATVGFADVDPNREQEVIRPIERPAPPSSFRGQWRPPRPPAEDQDPKPVPLGAPTSESPDSLAVWASGFGLVPLRGTDASAIASGEIGVALHYEPLVRTPLAFDADLRASGYLAGDLDARRGGQSRPVVRARQLQVRYGDEASAFAALGRLRYASAMLGMLDGARVQTPSLGGLTLGAFGGFVPDPLSSTPSPEATRFGGELAFQNAKSETRWRAVVGAHASRFDGAIDERRVTALAEVSPRFGHFAGWSEVSFYDAANPWGAPTAELSAAGLQAGVRIGPLDVGLHGGLERPERSRWLASQLPPEWLCIGDESPSAICVENDAVLSAGGDVSLRVGRTQLTVGGTGSRTEGADAEQLAVFTNARFSNIARYLYVETGVTGTRGTMLEGAALVVGPGLSLFDDRADLSVRYRPAITRYAADNVAFIEHGVGGAVWLGVIRDVDFSLDVDVLVGGEIELLMTQAVVLWRPDI